MKYISHRNIKIRKNIRHEIKIRKISQHNTLVTALFLKRNLIFQRPFSEANE